MLQSPLRRDGTRRVVVGGPASEGPGRGTVVASFEAKFHGCVAVARPGGADVCMDAVSRIHALKVQRTRRPAAAAFARAARHAPAETRLAPLCRMPHHALASLSLFLPSPTTHPPQQKPQNVDIIVTHKGIYVDDPESKELIRKVPVANLSWVSADPRNKKLFSFFVNEPRCGRIECNTFSLKKNGKDFVKCCNKLIADLAADSSRAEAEAMLIAAATPIMPVTMSASAARGNDDGEGRLIRAARRTSTRLGDVSDTDGGLLNGAGDDLTHTPFIAEDAWTDSPAMANALGVFRAKYLGGVPVKEIEGFRVVQDAARRVKDSGMEDLKQDVSLIVTEGQVVVAERDTGDHLH